MADSSLIPDLVLAFAERSVPADATPREVRLEQRGEMRLRPGGRTIGFTAVERIAVDRIEFSWLARFPFALRVTDGYRDGAGELAVRLLGVPLQRERGPEASSGEALRYLAELPFAPPAILHNPQLEWDVLDARSVEVAARVDGERLSAVLDFDDAGNVVRASSRMRRRKVDGTWRTTPWGGEFGGYAELDGLWLPTSGEAYWDLPEGRYVYWRGTLSAARLLLAAT